MTSSLSSSIVIVGSHLSHMLYACELCETSIYVTDTNQCQYAFESTGTNITCSGMYAVLILG
jgi:hypothetical protein